MIVALLLCAGGVIVGVPIVLYGFIRLDERPGRLSWLILLAGLIIIAVPVMTALVLHQEGSGNGRYVGR